MIENISLLLHNHDCVIIPGLGGFVANYRPCVIREDKNIFLPPAKEIGFNRSLIHNDGLLTNYVSQKDEISYDDARIKIDEFVVEVRSQVASGKSMDLGDIGSLRGDAIGNILFTPAAVNTFLPEAFGLTSFRFEPLDYSHAVRFEREIRLPRIMQRKSKRYWGAVAAMMAGLFFLPTSDLNSPETLQEAGLVNILQPAVSPVEYVKSDDNLEKKVVSYENVVNVRAEVVEVFEPVVKRFHIIAASFVQHEPARKAMEVFKSEGYNNARIIDDEAGRIRIALDSYELREDAIQRLENLRKQPGFSSVWVYRSK